MGSIAAAHGAQVCQHCHEPLHWGVCVTWLFPQPRLLHGSTVFQWEGRA